MKIGITNLNEFLFSFLVAGICCVSAGAIPSNQASGKVKKDETIYMHKYLKSFHYPISNYCETAWKKREIHRHPKFFRQINLIS